MRGREYCLFCQIKCCIYIYISFNPLWINSLPNTIQMMLRRLIMWSEDVVTLNESQKRDCCFHFRFTFNTFLGLLYRVPQIQIFFVSQTYAFSWDKVIDEDEEKNFSLEFTSTLQKSKNYVITCIFLFINYYQHFFWAIKRRFVVGPESFWELWFIG